MSNDNQQHNSEKPENQSSDVRYVPIEYLQAMQEDEDRIELDELIKIVWEGRWVVVKTVGLFIILGLFIAFISNEEYTSEVKLLPESQQQSSLGGLGGLAQQFGFSPGAQESSTGIPTALYPDITQSTVFLQRLMRYDVLLPETGESITVNEYMRDHQKRSFADVIKRYTIRLPFTIRNWIIGADRDDEFTGIDQELAGEERIKRLIQMSSADWERIRNLRERVTSSVNPETGTVSVMVKMQDGVIAADLANRVVELLSDYITEYRTEKFRQDVEFIEARYEDSRETFEEAQRELAQFNDENRGQLTAMATTNEQLLQSRYNLTFNLYTTMAERLEEARIKLQEETPVVNILEPAAIPDKRSEPKRAMLLIIYTILGGVVGVGFIFGSKVWETISLKIQD